MITPPILGRISIGRLVEKNGKRLPEKDDQFTITSQIQTAEGWVKHPLDDKLRQQAPQQKLRSIPVRMLFDDPELNLRAEYTLFDRQTGRPICIRNGENCQRLEGGQKKSYPCPSPHYCSLGKNGQCKPYGRLYVNLNEEDELGSFIFRTTGFNSIRTLTARLRYYQVASNDNLSCLPLQLTLRGKSTTQSYKTPIYYVDLTLQEGTNLHTALNLANTIKAKSIESGFDQKAIDAVARQGYDAFLSEEELDMVEEFYPSNTQEAQTLIQGLTQSVHQVQ